VETSLALAYESRSRTNVTLLSHTTHSTHPTKYKDNADQMPMTNSQKHVHDGFVARAVIFKHDSARLILTYLVNSCIAWLH
jgi:hypothetical protein